ncbi:hypothetical protein AKO1_007459 [Acrasis kona]|uniref:Methyltransferase type 11 domain-containing protein n=1 Tax=Acrasis kona TaxID=1008807 RepID=A0AAW2YRR6_9EUKA
MDLYSDGFSDIVSVDFSKTAISEMNKLGGDKPGLAFIEMDLLEMNFPKNTFDCIIDKATMDIILCGDEPIKTIQNAFKNIYRVLRPSGVFMMLSYAKSQLRLPFLKNKQYPWDISVETCGK